MGQITPGLLGVVVHDLTEVLPVQVRVRGLNTTGRRRRNSGELIVAKVIGLTLHRLILVHGINLSEEPIGVIGKLVGIGQKMLHSGTTLGNIFERLMLLNQRIFKGDGILIQNAGGLDTEVINDGGGFGT